MLALCIMPKTDTALRDRTGATPVFGTHRLQDAAVTAKGSGLFYIGVCRFRMVDLLHLRGTGGYCVLPERSASGTFRFLKITTERFQA